MLRTLALTPLPKAAVWWLLLPLLAVSLWLSENHLSLFLVGALLGASLNYFQFGFRTCSHQLLTQGRTLGVRAVLWMLAFTSVLFFLLLSLGEFNGQALQGFVQPLSLSVVAGAFLFGIGMQLANGCTSGTFNKMGQLQPLSLTSFFFLLVGGTLAAYHSEFWRAVPALQPVSMLQSFGLIQGLILQLGFIGVLYWLAILKEKNHFDELSRLNTSAFWKITDWHPWLKAGLVLALLNAFLLILSGQPWSIANVFPYWGLKISDALQLPLDWSFWSYGITHFSRQEAPLLEDTVSLTTLGLISGALLVTLLARSARQEATQFTLKPHLMAIIGGFIMGYGSVIAFGCNIGAFFSGIGSGSLHGWLWALAALAGNSAGIYLKARLFRD
jgi:YeeE/YedE family (DUF395).